MALVFTPLMEQFLQFWKIENSWTDIDFSTLPSLAISNAVIWYPYCQGYCQWLANLPPNGLFLQWMKVAWQYKETFRGQKWQQINFSERKFDENRVFSENTIAKSCQIRPRSNFEIRIVKISLHIAHIECMYEI